MNVQPLIHELESQKERLENAITILHTLNGGSNGHSRRGGKRHMSAAARRRISLAQKARWAEWSKKRALRNRPPK